MMRSHCLGKKEHTEPLKTIPKADIKVLNQEISDEEGTYRIQAGHRVHYLTIPTTVFDEPTTCRPYLLIPQLPEFPDSDWTTMHISRGENGQLESTISYDVLPSIQRIWHPQLIDVLALEQTERHRSHVHEVIYNGKPAISKIATFEWQLSSRRSENMVYSELAEHQSEKPEEPALAPQFLGHLVENGRVIGFLLEKVEGGFASIEDLPKCEDALRRLHAIGLVHGDVNRYNFIINRSDGHVRMVDFEHANEFDEMEARLELESLPSELSEETGRGGPSILRKP
jgi:serine/threonine protein kinase